MPFFCLCERLNLSPLVNQLAHFLSARVCKHQMKSLKLCCSNCRFWMWTTDSSSHLDDIADTHSWVKVNAIVLKRVMKRTFFPGSSFVSGILSPTIWECNQSGPGDATEPPPSCWPHHSLRNVCPQRPSVSPQCLSRLLSGSQLPAWRNYRDIWTG